MQRRLVGGLAISLLGVALAGCGGGNGEAPKTVAKFTPPPLADLLQEPRAELAKRIDVLLDEVKTRDLGRRRATVKLGFLPDWYEPLVVPCFHEAKFQAAAGLSLPSYADLANLSADKALALQLAQFGDHDGAVKVAGGTSNAELDALKLEKSFPVEWTRLVAIYFYGLEQQIAIGELRALHEFLEAQDQLAKLLEGKARESALGRALLSRGRTTLTLSAKALRTMGQEDEAAKADGFLERAGKNLPQLNLGGDQKALAERLKVQPQGSVLIALPAQRALDLLHLPLSRDGAEAVVLFCEKDKGVREAVVTYTPLMRRECDEAAEVSAGLTTLAAPTIAGKNGPVVHVLDGVKAETSLCPVNESFGGWVCLKRSEAKAPDALPRSIGPIHLENTLETTRLAIAPQVQAEPLVIDDERLLSKIENPVSAAKLVRVELLRVEGHDLVREAQYRLGAGKSLHEVAGPLFVRLGSPKISNVSDAKRTYLTLTWEDAVTQWTLRLADDVREPTLLALRDRREPAQAAERQAAVATHEKAERANRLQANKPLQKLPRKLEQFPLGMLRTEFLKFAPQGRTVVKRELEDAVLVAVNSPPPPDRAFVTRQIVARFDSNKQVSWLRVRYEAGTTQARQANWAAQMLGTWRTAGGAVSPAASPYAALETDLPGVGTAAKFYSWSDDVTRATCLVEPNGVELTIWNRGPDDEAPKPLAFLPTGLQTAQLGMTLSQAKAALGGEAEAMPDGSMVFRPAQGPFDAVVVWSENEQIRQLAGRFRTGATVATTPADLEKALMTQWGSEIAKIVWPTRRDYHHPKTLQALTWHDDVTRYRLYWAESVNSPARLWAEWKRTAK